MANQRLRRGLSAVLAGVLLSLPSVGWGQERVWDVQHQCYRQPGTEAECGARWDVGQRAYIGRDTDRTTVRSEKAEPSEAASDRDLAAPAADTDTTETLRKLQDRAERVRALSGVASELLGLSGSGGGSGEGDR